MRLPTIVRIYLYSILLTGFCWKSSCYKRINEIPTRQKFRVGVTSTTEKETTELNTEVETEIDEKEVTELTIKNQGLRHVRVHVPVAVKAGDTAVLRCLFDLGEDTLYSVKWYKGGREIFRYLPRDTPSIKIFPIQGLEDLHVEGIKRLYPQHFDRRRELRKLNHSLLVNFLDLIDLLVRCPESPRRAEKVEDLSLLFIHIHHLLNEFRPHQARETLRVMMDLQKRQRIEISQRFQKHLDKKSKSNATHLVLKKVSVNLSGRYSCEVSADAPSFRTAFVSGDMNIVVIPKTLPEIQGMKPRYRVGDVLKATCTSKHSKPAANLTWALNGNSADSESISYTSIKKDPKSDLETSISTLSIELQRHHFSQSGRLKLKCTASIHNIYWRTSENSAEEEKPKEAVPAQDYRLHVVHSTETTALPSSTNNSETSYKNRTKAFSIFLILTYLNYHFSSIFC